MSVTVTQRSHCEMNAARKKDKHGVIGTMLCLHADVPTSERRQEEEEVGKVSGVKGHVSN